MEPIECRIGEYIEAQMAEATSLSNATQKMRQAKKFIRQITEMNIERYLEHYRLCGQFAREVAE